MEARVGKEKTRKGSKILAGEEVYGSRNDELVHLRGEN